MDFIFGYTNDKKVINSVINSSYVSVKECEDKDILRIGESVKLTAKKEFDSHNNVIGYRKLDFHLKPHYYFNGDRHNGNMMTINQTIEVLNDIFDKLNIGNPNRITATTLENGLNIIPDMYDTKDIITQSLYYKKKPLIKFRQDWAYYKTTKPYGTHPSIYAKLYHKGEDKNFAQKYPKEVHANAYRYEFGNSTNKKLIELFGANTFKDLFNIDTHTRIAEYLLKNWDYVMLLDEINEYSDITNPNYYEDRRHFRNGLNDARKKYYNGHGIWHKEIKRLIEYTQEQQFEKMQIRTLIDSWNLHTETKTDIVGICIEKRKCIVTGLDITMQKEESQFLCFGGLRYYFEYKHKIYEELKRKYLRADKYNLSPDEQFYYISHNIRNRFTNEIHNRKKFEKRNYPPNQLRLF